jgi:hypothetical protein
VERTDERHVLSDDGKEVWTITATGSARTHQMRGRPRRVPSPSRKRMTAPMKMI